MMSDEVFAPLSDEDNYVLLDQACMLVRAAEDILVNESSDIFHIVYAYKESDAQKNALNRLDLLFAGVCAASKILNKLSSVDRDSWAT